MLCKVAVFVGGKKASEVKKIGVQAKRSLQRRWQQWICKARTRRLLGQLGHHRYRSTMLSTSSRLCFDNPESSRQHQTRRLRNQPRQGAHSMDGHVDCNRCAVC